MQSKALLRTSSASRCSTAAPCSADVCCATKYSSSRRSARGAARVGLYKPPLFPRPFADPVQELIVPEDRVLRLADPVPLIGKQQQLRRHLLHLQRGEKLQALSHRNAIIQLAV